MDEHDAWTYRVWKTETIERDGTCERITIYSLPTLLPFLFI